MSNDSHTCTINIRYLACRSPTARMRRMLRSALLKSLIIFAFLFVQQGAVMHNIVHIVSERSHKQSLPHEKYCKLCAAYAHFSSAINIGPIHFDFESTFEAAHASQSAVFRSIAFTAFAARAPPYSA
jgi:hypothetical protein